MAASDLLNTSVPGSITSSGVRSSVATSLAYSAAWLAGNGCIPLNNLMEDAATAEITRVQLWQYVKYSSRLADTGTFVTAEYIDKLVDEEIPVLLRTSKTLQEKNLEIVGRYLKKQVRQEWPSEFLTSDLMYYLEAADGVDATIWQRAQL